MNLFKVLVVLESNVEFLAVNYLVLLLVLLISYYECWLVDIQMFWTQVLGRLLLLERCYIVKLRLRWLAEVVGN